MIYKKYKLEKCYSNPQTGDKNIIFTAYMSSNSKEIDLTRKHPAVVICPGGAYIDLSERESEPVAIEFMSKGFYAFVLNYTTYPNAYPDALIDVSVVVAWLRKNAAELSIDPEKIFTCGFSAGAHLAASAGVYWKNPEIYEHTDIAYGSGRPDGMILCYPVVSENIACERINSFDYLISDKEQKQLRTENSLPNGIDETTPPAFIWHTFEDATVPVKSAIVLAEALEKNNVKFELHIFSNGPHGLSLCNHQTAAEDKKQYYNSQVEEWKELCYNWLKKEFGIKF